MNKIIAIIRPFDNLQNIYAYKDSEKLGSTTSTLADFPEKTMAMCDSYNTERVEIIGPKDYVVKFGEELKTLAATKYNKTNLDVHYI